MTICNTENSWSQFLHFIEERCSATEFQNWIAPIQFIEGNEKEIVLQVPNIFVQEYLLDNHKKHLAHFFPTSPSGEPMVRFQIIEAKKPQALPSITPIIRTTEENGFELRLNPNYHFDNFIEGPSNQFVKSAAMGIAARPGKSYNPLFIHGGVGLGKTHLLHAIGHQAKIEHRKLKIQCITTEGFINDLVDHLKTKSIDKMKRFYRTLDILLVDDIQFLQSRLNFEEEFCNTFESLIHQNRQIVITSDKPPGQLKLSERLIARMEWGLVAHVGMPELETRVAIIQQKAEIKGIKIPQPIAFYIAEHIVHNVRQLEGAINRLCAFSRLLGKPIDDEIVEKALGELIQPLPGKKITVEAILKSVAAVYNVRITDIKGETRAQEIVFARQVAMYLAKELIDDTIMKISASFGGKSHSTLLHAWKKISQQVEKDDLLRRQIQLVRRGLEIS